MIALLMPQHAEQMDRVGIFLVSLDDLTVQLRSRPRSAGLVHFNGGGEKVLHRGAMRGFG